MKKVLLKIFCAILFFCINFDLYAFKFLVTSDIHVGAINSDTIAHYNNKKAQFIKMLQYIVANKDTSFVIFAGDLTDTRGETTFNTFKNDWVSPLTDLNVGYYLCIGNHDETGGCTESKAARNFIKKRYGDVRYSFDKGGVHFICCGLYPDYSENGCNCCAGFTNCKDTILWLKEDLKGIGQKPVILFFHYNLTKLYSDWMPNDAKQELYEVLQDTNILNIFTGHYHYTYTDDWKLTNDGKTFKTTCVGGSEFAVCDYSDGKLTVGFMSAESKQLSLTPKSHKSDIVTMLSDSLTRLSLSTKGTKKSTKNKYSNYDVLESCINSEGVDDDENE